MSAALDLFPPVEAIALPARSPTALEVVIELAGDPVGKGRPRFVRATGRAYTPAKTANYQTTLTLAAQDVMNGRPLIDGPVAVEITARFAIPLSWSKKARAAALAGMAYAPRTPDADNLMKMCDGLNGIVWRDDRQVVVAQVVKFYAPAPGITIVVRPL